MKIYNYFSFFIFLLSFFVIFIWNIDLYILLILPMIYLMSKIILLVIKNSNIIYTKLIFDVFGLIRLVVLPACIVIFNDKNIDNLPLGTNYFNKGVLLICIEYLVGAIFLMLLSAYKFNKNKIARESYKGYRLLGNKYVYIIFMIITLSLFTLFPSVRETISFIIIKTDATGRGSEEATSFIVLIRMFIQLSLLLLFVITSYYFYKKYINENNVKYVVFPLIVGLLNISLIVGERRTIQLYTLVSVLVIISLLFKKHKVKINLLILIVGSIILILMTLYKELYIFNFNSYNDALESKSISNIKFVDQLQSYFYGPQNVGASIDYLNYYTSSIKGFFYDLVRSTSGLNFFVNKDTLITSQLFNKLIYGNEQLTGHLISSAGYGYIYFGPILFPLISIFNITLATIVESLVKRTNKLEIIFIGTFIYMRIATNIFGNPMPIISVLSSTIIVYGSVILIAVLFEKIKTKVLI
ncbi:O-antigen polymerase [Mammaliicoccus sciuri]|uniref:O-antigen polymerase n=1 Tax=Mammaliicoccus sciuri TaxID=1296 RepID=UPI000D1E4630|nr:O-antigen polymerase [Mammaliicoccus sciuri]PTK07590.1 capsular biosynthesis protein [Mammaliicoccus sciuri]